MKWRILILAGIIALPGCGTFGGNKSNLAPPSKLEPIEQKVKLKELWSEDTGNGTSGQYVKLVPAMAPATIYVGDFDGKVSAYAKDSGKRLWRKNVKEHITGATGFALDTVYVGSVRGHVFALDSETGDLKWTAEASSEVLAPPVGNGEVVVAKTIDGKLFGFDAISGSKSWIYQRTVPTLSLRGVSTPVLVQNVVLSGFASGKLTANDVATGRLLWEISVTHPSGKSEIDRLSDVDAQPLIHGLTLYTAAYNGEVSAISLRTGRRLWQRPISSENDMATDGKALYVVDNSSLIHAVDMQTGMPLWTQDALKGRRLTGPAVIEDYIAVADLDGYVHLLDPADGKLVGRKKLGGGATLATPISDGDRLYLLNEKGRLIALAIE